MKRNIGAILFSVILISVITFPFLWLLLGSFKTMKELFSVPIRFFPEHISLDNYIAVFKAQPFGLYLYNSFVIALLGTVLVVVASAMASYSLARIPIKGKKLVLILVLTVSLLPPVTLLNPIYQTMSNIGLLNTRIGVAVVLAAIELPTAVWLLTSFFQSIPIEIEESAMLDGASMVGGFVRVVVPLVMPGVFTVSIMTFLAVWNMFTATVTVKNTGSVSGKSVVQLYVQTPYGDYEKQNAVEKSAVQVIGYGKTDELKPGQSEQVTVTMDRYMMASYDYTNAKGYILSAGDYYLALGDNAHDALNNILAAKGASGMVDQDGNTVEGNAAKTYRWNYDTLDTESYRYSVTGEEVTNQFDDCNANYWQEGSVTYLTRQDWNGTFPTKAPAITCTEEMMQILQGELYTKPEDSPSVSDITQGQNNGLTFVSMKDVSFDDTETWDKYLDQMTVEELASQISDMFGTPEVSSVAKPAFSEGDGTASVGANTFPEEYGDTRDVCLYPCSVVAACMWNNDRLTRRGELMAEEALYCKLPLFWTGGGNLHRTPFGGRNGEYFSEDAVLTNLYTTTELTAVQSRGVTPGIKHVAGNDQEFHREGLAVFFNEQAFREQTLRAFEGALSNENTMALMQSFNRLGLVWSSSSKALCTQVLRKEWGFNGQQETDGVAGGAYKSHFATSLSAGTTTYCIDPTGSAASAIVEEIRSNDDGNMLLNLRDAVKRYHYMLSHTNLINGLSMNATVESIMPWWQIALYAIDVVFALLMVGSLFMMFRAKRRSEEKA